MRHVVQEWCAAAFERVAIHGCIVRRASLPPPIAEAKPCAGHGSHGRLVRLARVAWLLGGDLSPAGRPWGFRRPRHTRVAQERRTLEAPVAPGLLAAACRHGCNPRLLLACLGSSVACPWCAKGHAAARGTDGPGPWQGVKQPAVGMVLGAWREGWSAVGNGWPGDAEVGHAGWHQEGVGGDDACSRGQRPRALDGLDAGREDVGSAPVGGPEAARTSGAPRAWRRFERRPGPEAVATDPRLVLLNPRQDVGTVVFVGPGQAVGAPHVVADHAPAVVDEWRQGTHRGALGGERRALVAVCAPPLDRELGLGGVSCGPARGTRCAVLRPGERLDGQEPEERSGAQRGPHGPVLEFQAHRDRLSGESRAPGLDPRIDRRGAVFEHAHRTSLRASRWSANSVCGSRPVEANKGRKGFACLWLQGCSPRVWYRCAQGPAGWRSAQAF
jgi:hypothetical protein